MNQWYHTLVRLIYRHSPAIIIAFIIGFITVLPYILQRTDEVRGYQGIAIRGTDTEEYYLIRIREAYDGHWRIASPDLFEYKQSPYVQPPLPEMAIAGAARLLGIDAVTFVIAGKFIFPFLLALVLYALTRLLTGNAALALVVPPAIILAGQTAVSPATLLALLHQNFGALSAMTDYTRPVNPQFSSLAFFFWLILWHQWSEQPRIKSWYIVGALLLGALVYVYIFAWMLGMGIVTLFLFASFFPRFRRFPQQAKTVGGYLAIALLITLPYWLNYYQVATHQFYDILQKRYGFYSSRTPLWSDLLCLDAILLIMFYWKKEKDHVFVLLLSFIASIAFLTNQQVFTGLRFYPGHWHWYYTTPLTIFLILWIILTKLQKWPRIKVGSAVAVVLVSFAIGVVKQYNGFARLRDQTAAEQRFAQPLKWLYAHTEKDDVVMANGTLNMLIPVYTHDNAYFSRWGEFYLVPHERFRDRMFARLHLSSVDEVNADQIITADNKDVYEYLFGRYELRKGECEDGCFSADDLSTVKDEYLAWRKNINFEEFLRRYRLDYAAWDTLNDPLWDLDKYPFFEYITEINGIRIYRMKQA